MKGLAAFVIREALEWRMLLVVSALAGFVPLVAPWLPQLARHGAAEVRLGVAVAVACLVGLAFLFQIGSATVVREVAEGRIGFYLARPCGARRLWLWKIIASWLVLVTCLGLMVLPTALVDGPAWFDEAPGNLEATKALPPIFGTRGAEYFFRLSWHGLPGALPTWVQGIYALVGLAVALLMVHGLTTGLRSRTWMLLVDIVAFVVVAGAVVFANRLLLAHQAFAPMVWWSRLVPPVLLALLLWAGARQLDLGRGDLELGHRVFSGTVWAVLLPLALATLLWARWVTEPTIDDLVGPQVVESAPAGPWIFVGGPTHGRLGAATAFLYDTERGESWRLGGLDAAAQWLTFSADGSRVVWARCHEVVRITCTLWEKPAGGAPPRNTGIEIEGSYQVVRLSQDGTLLAVAQDRTVTVYALPSTQQLARWKVDSFDLRQLEIGSEGPGGLWVRMAVGEDLGDRFQILVEKVDLATQRSEEVGTLPDLTVAYRGCRTAEDNLLLTSSLSPPRFQIADGESLEILYEVQSPQPQQWRCLGDGRVALLLGGVERGTTLRIVDLRSGEIVDHSMPAETAVIVGPEIRPGWLSLGFSSRGRTRLEGFEVASGETEHWLDDAYPLLRDRRFETLDEVPVGSPASRLIFGKGGAIQSFDPETHQTTTHLGPFPGLTGDPRFQIHPALRAP